MRLKLFRRIWEEFWELWKYFGRTSLLVVLVKRNFQFFHKLQHALPSTVLFPLVYMQFHIGIIAESARNDPQRTDKFGLSDIWQPLHVLFILSPIVRITIEVSQQAEQHSVGAVTPEVLLSLNDDFRQALLAELLIVSAVLVSLLSILDDGRTGIFQTHKVSDTP